MKLCDRLRQLKGSMVDMPAGSILALAGLVFLAAPATLLLVPELFLPGLVATLLISTMAPVAPNSSILRESAGWIILLVLFGFILIGGQIPGCQRDSYEDSGPPYCGERYGCD